MCQELSSLKTFRETGRSGTAPCVFGALFPPRAGLWKDGCVSDFPWLCAGLPALGDSTSPSGGHVREVHDNKFHCIRQTVCDPIPESHQLGVQPGVSAIPRSLERPS